MEVIDKGHTYSLDSMDNGKVVGPIKQHISFIKKENVDGEFVTVMNGTTNEEVLAMLIDRMMVLQEKFPCKENAIVITNLEESLMWLEKRTSDQSALQFLQG